MEPYIVMSAQRCPTCHADFDPARSSAMPFCSERCRMVDLGRWIDERYGLPVSRVPGEDNDAQELEPDHDAS